MARLALGLSYFHYGNNSGGDGSGWSHFGTNNRLPRARVDLAGHRRRDQGGAAFLEDEPASTRGKVGRYLDGARPNRLPNPQHPRGLTRFRVTTAALNSRVNFTWSSPLARVAFKPLRVGQRSSISQPWLGNAMTASLAKGRAKL